MANRSVSSLAFCKDDMRRAYREKIVTSRRRRIKIRDIIDILDIIVPIIPHFFGSNTISANSNCGAGPDNHNGYNNTGGGNYGREDDMPFYCSSGGGGRHYGGHGNANNQYGMRMARPDDYYDREISEEEFERLLDYAEQCNNSKMY